MRQTPCRFHPASRQSLSPGRPAPPCIGVKHPWLALRCRPVWPAASPSCCWRRRPSWRRPGRSSVASRRVPVEPGQGRLRLGARAGAGRAGARVACRLRRLAEPAAPRLRRGIRGRAGLHLRRPLLELGIARQHPAALQRALIRRRRSCRRSFAGWRSSTGPAPRAPPTTACPTARSSSCRPARSSRPSTSRT